MTYRLGTDTEKAARALLGISDMVQAQEGHTTGIHFSVGLEYILELNLLKAPDRSVGFRPDPTIFFQARVGAAPLDRNQIQKLLDGSYIRIAIDAALPHRTGNDFAHTLLSAKQR